MKKISSLMLLGALATGFTGCFGGEVNASPVAAIGSKSGEIALIVSDKTNPFFIDMTNGAANQIVEYDTKGLQIFGSENKKAKELENVKAAIAGNAKIILLNPIDPT